MVLVNIYSTGKIDNFVPVLSCSVGEHVLGAENKALQCSRLGVSPRHAILKVGKNGATISALNTNELHYQLAGAGGAVTVVKNGTNVTLQNEDKFAFTPDDLWYKIQIIKEENMPLDEDDIKVDNNNKYNTSSLTSRDVAAANNTYGSNDSLMRELDDLLADGDSSSSLKRSNDTEDSRQTPMKRIKSENPSDIETSVEPISSADVAGLRGHLGEGTSDIKVEESELSTDQLGEGSNNIKIEETEASTSDNGPAEAGPERNEPSADATENNEASTGEVGGTNNSQPCDVSSSTDTGPSNPTAARRDRCWYGDRCYRKNPSHKTEFSHPGDPDYNTVDPNDTRPLCAYGDSCYRRSSQHRSQYRHTSGPAPRPTGNGRVVYHVCADHINCPYNRVEYL